jgi:hypothetical protein
MMDIFMYSVDIRNSKYLLRGSNQQIMDSLENKWRVWRHQEIL